MSSVLVLNNVIKVYGTKKNPVKALGPVSLSIEKGSFTVILGRSGSGKSTMLNLLAGLDKVSEGTLIALGKDLSKANPGELARYRGSIGVIFQFYNLLPNLNTLENVMMGSWAGGKSIQESQARELLDRFGLSHRVSANVKVLSGGEKQRVAICRALVGNPGILFCDEPTGALDSVNENQVRDILIDLNKQGLTIVMVTHNPDFATYADKVIRLSDGLIESNEMKKEHASVSL